MLFLMVPMFPTIFPATNGYPVVWIKWYNSKTEIIFAFNFVNAAIGIPKRINNKHPVILVGFTILIEPVIIPLLNAVPMPNRTMFGEVRRMCGILK
ncbi:hypothetical protein A9Q96_09560 [Rhodobacterales bacterium 52_120_T64]|nr:hypothetical protein A9Q96_09560 [Rhodobacterales bacterium 52_120_T64]